MERPAVTSMPQKNQHNCHSSFLGRSVEGHRKGERGRLITARIPTIMQTCVSFNHIYLFVGVYVPLCKCKVRGQLKDTPHPHQWVLGIELRSSALAASPSTHWAALQTPQIHFLISVWGFGLLENT